MTALVGRAGDVAAAVAALRAARLVTLTGPAGAGRTRLAAAVAAEFPAGRAFAEAAPLRSEHLAQAVAAAVDVTERPGQPLDQALRERFGAGRWLLVLDGCEHAPEAAAGLVGGLLDGCPGLSVLAVAGAPLGVAGERVLPVPPLAAEDAAALFRERAGDAAPVPSRLGGLPLAIELAAARAGSPIPAGASPRAAADWSCGLLDEHEHRLLRRLAVFVRGFDLEAARQVGDRADAGELVARLARRSLAVPDGARWRLPSAVRAHALDRLAADPEEPDCRRRQLAWAAGVAAELERLLEADGPWRPRFDEVADDLREAVDAAGTGPAGHGLARSLAHLCYARRFLLEARCRYEAAAAHAADDAAAAADLRDGADVSLAQHLGEPALRLLLASARHAEAAGDDAAGAIALAHAVCAGSRFPATFTDEVPYEELCRLQARAEAAAPAGDALAAAYVAAAAAWNATGIKTLPDPALAEAALEAARAADHPVLVIGALDAVMSGHGATGRFREAQQLGRERIRQFHRLRRHDPHAGVEIIDTLHVAPLVAVAAGDLATALAAARMASDDPFSGLYMRASKHVVPLVLSGRFDEALEVAATMWDGWRGAGRPAARWMAPAVHAVALVHGLRGRAAEHREWLERADRLAAPRGHGHVSDSFAAFADARLALHTGALDDAVAAAVDLAAVPAWGSGKHQFFDACSWSVAAEVAVAAGLPDAAGRLAAAAPAGEESGWAEACLARATGRLHGDRDALCASLAGWERIGARFERACTLLLLPDRAGEGRAELAELGCPPPRS